MPQQGQVTSAFLAAISFKNAVKVCPQFLHKTSTVGSLIVSCPVRIFRFPALTSAPRAGNASRLSRQPSLRCHNHVSKFENFNYTNCSTGEDQQVQKFAIRLQYLLVIFVSFIALTFATAQTIPPALYSGLEWRLIGPFRGGRAIAVSGIPGNSTTFYSGSVGGGVWRTTDAGMVWEPIFNGQPIASIGAIAVAPSDPKVIYVGTGEADIRSNLASGDGVYKSTDAGQTWTNIGLRDTRQISSIVVDPQNANIVYVGALGHAYAPNNERGVYKSTDGGASWTKVLDQGPDIGVSDLVIAAEDSGLLFATTWRSRRPPWSTYAPLDGPGSGLFRSQDHGQSWSRLTKNGLPEGDWGRTAVAVSPNGKRVYAVVSGSKIPGLYRSDDGGNTWTLQNDDRRLTSRAWYFGNITVDPNNPDVLYVPNVALYRSEDGGKTISVVRGAPGGDDYHQIWVDPKDSSRMILATDQGVTISLDYGRTWSTWYNQPTGQFYHVITDDQFPVRCLRHAAGQRKRSRTQSRRFRADHAARLVSGQRQRERIHRSRPERSEHPLRQRHLRRRRPLQSTNLVRPGHYSLADVEFCCRNQRSQVSRSLDTRAAYVPVRQENTLSGHAVRNEDTGRRAALGDHQP